MAKGRYGAASDYSQSWGFALSGGYVSDGKSVERSFDGAVFES
jgi:hypothetical protein